MGFYIRKALRVGPLRFNLSKAGIGVSAGIKGLRLGTGPSGNYIHVGRGGLYFRKSIPSRSSPAPPSTSEAKPLPSNESSSSVSPLDDIESGSVLQMVDGSSSELLRELNEKRKKARLLPGSILIAAAGLLVLSAAEPPQWLMGLTLVAGIALCWVASMRDAMRKTTVILYGLEPEIERAYADLHDAFSNLRSCSRIWHIEARGEVRDAKYHAGAEAVVRRTRVSSNVGTPPFVKTNVSVPLLPVGRQLLAFMPDRVLVFDVAGVGAVAYDDLWLDMTQAHFAEAESLPSDAVVVGQTWRYVNKKGGPDRRFQDNREIPICAYDQLHFFSTTGLNEIIQLSRSSAGIALGPALSSMRGLAPEDRAQPIPRS